MSKFKIKVNFFLKNRLIRFNFHENVLIGRRNLFI